MPRYEELEVRGQHQRIPHEVKLEQFSLFCEDEHLARQEFKSEVDTGTLMRRYGAGAAFGPPPQYGEVDFTMTLQDAIHSVREARDAFARLPDEVRAKYRSWDEVALAIAAGELKAPEAPAGGSGGASGASASPQGAPGTPAGS